jgi:hypothetical protein
MNFNKFPVIERRAGLLICFRQTQDVIRCGVTRKEFTVDVGRPVNFFHFGTTLRLFIGHQVSNQSGPNPKVVLELFWFLNYGNNTSIVVGGFSTVGKTASTQWKIRRLDETCTMITMEHTHLTVATRLAEALNNTSSLSVKLKNSSKVHKKHSTIVLQTGTEILNPVLLVQRS